MNTPKKHLTDTEADDYLRIGAAHWLDQSQWILWVNNGDWHPASGIWQKIGEQSGFTKIDGPERVIPDLKELKKVWP